MDSSFIHFIRPDSNAFLNQSFDKDEVYVKQFKKYSAHSSVPWGAEGLIELSTHYVPALHHILYNDFIFPFWQLCELGITYPHRVHKITVSEWFNENWNPSESDSWAQALKYYRIGSLYTTSYPACFTMWAQVFLL